MDDIGTAEMFGVDECGDIYNTHEPDPGCPGRTEYLKLGIPTLLRPAVQLPCPPYYGVCPSAIGSNHWINWYQFLGSALSRWSRMFMDVVDKLEPIMTSVELLNFREDGTISFTRQVPIWFSTGGLDTPKKFHTTGIVVCYGPGDCEFAGNGILIRSGSGKTLYSGSGIVIKSGSGPCTIVGNGVLIDSSTGPVSVIPSHKRRLRPYQDRNYEPHPLVVTSHKVNTKVLCSQSSSVYRDTTSACVYVCEIESESCTSFDSGSFKFIFGKNCDISVIRSGRDQNVRLTSACPLLHVWKEHPEITIYSDIIHVEDINDFVYSVANGLETLELEQFHIVVRKMIGEVGFVLEIRARNPEGSLGNVTVNESCAFMEAMQLSGVRLGFRVRFGSYAGCSTNGKPSFNVVRGKGDKLICLRVTFSS